MKIGVLKEGFTKCEDDVCGVVRAAIAKFEGLGATVEEVSVPQHYDGKWSQRPSQSLKVKV